MAVVPLGFEDWTERWEVDTDRATRSKVAFGISPRLRVHLPRVLRLRFRDRLSGPPQEPLWEHLPLELKHISEAIHSSREVLELEDEEGKRLCSEETWTRAVTFLAKNASWLFSKRGRIIDAPRVWAGPDQSIDLSWDTPSYELLLNVRADPKQPAGFYGDDKGAGKRYIKGTLDLSQFNDGLLLWLENYSGALA